MFKGPLKIGTSFDGINAPEQALQQLKIPYEHLWGFEIDKFARKSIKANYPDYPLYEDIFDAKPNELPPVDIYIAGFSCQPYSTAGLKLGENDIRSDVIYPMLKIIKSVKPPVIMIENVRDFLSDRFKKIRNYLFHTLSDYGYHIKYQVMNTMEHGVPQHRKRVYIIGFLDLQASFDFQFPNPFKLEKRLKHLLEPEPVADKYYYSNDMIKYFNGLIDKFDAGKRKVKHYHNLVDPEGHCPCIVSTYYKDGSECILHIADLDVNAKDANKRIYDPEGVAPALTTSAGGYREPKIRVLNGHTRTSETGQGGSGPLVKDDGVSFCLSTQPHANILKISNTVKLIEGERYRKLTPRECLRLQDFDDSFQIVVSNTQAYIQAGNAMSCNVLRKLFYQIYCIGG